MLKVTFTHMTHEGDERRSAFKTHSLDNYPQYFNFFDITVDGEPVNESPINLTNLDFSDDDIVVKEIVTKNDIEKLLEGMGYDIFELEYNDGDSDGVFKTEYQGYGHRFMVVDSGRIDVVS